MLKQHSPRWLSLYNDDSNEIPAFGLVEITGASYDLSNPNIPGIVIKGTRPTGDSITQVAANSWKPIPYGETGLVTLDGPVLIAANAITTSVGDAIGTATDSFYPDADETGLTVLGDMGDDYLLVDFTRGGEGGQKKQFCRFSAGAAFTTSSSSVTGSIDLQWGNGTDHTTTTSVTFNNMLTSTASTYLFEGDSSDKGIALYSGSGTTWHIVQMECP